jgi:hypothetical protein
MELKARHDPNFRGMVPKEIVRKLSASVNLSQFDPSEIHDIIIAVGDSARSMDTYLMYKAAREVELRVDEFSVAQLLSIANVYSKRDLCDEDLFESIQRIVMDDNRRAQFSHMVSLLRSLSRVSIINQDLCGRLSAQVQKEKRLSSKDITSCLIALADLGYTKDVEMIAFLWSELARRKNVAKYTSHDDQYGLIMAALVFPNFISIDLIDQILKVATCQGNSRKRIGLFRKCVANNLLPPEFDRLLLTTSTYVPGKRPGTQEVSSGFHLEVSNTLKTIRVKHKDEVDLGEFILDIVI